jgi:glycosyltransferase involved in cell wall biosynthesis
MDPKVSIVIACYNDPFVEDAVKSALKQTYKNKEVILINDGSTDTSTLKILDALKPKVQVFRQQENSGQSNARNNGIKRAKGKYILNLDSDDFFEPEFVGMAVEHMEDSEDIKIVTCKARRFSKKGEIDIFTPRGGKLDQFLFHNSALGSSMFRKKDWEHCGGYEENLPILGFEDWELFLNMLKGGGIAYVIPKVLFHYRVREGSTTDRIKKEKHDKFHHIINKHKDLYIEKFDDLMLVLFHKLKAADLNNSKIQTKLEYRIGRTLIKPFRKIKRAFNF